MSPNNEPRVNLRNSVTDPGMPLHEATLPGAGEAIARDETSTGEGKNAALIAELRTFHHDNAADALEAAEARNRGLEAENARIRADLPICDGGCYTEGAPVETCSAHGRKVAEVWEIVATVQARLDGELAEHDRVIAEKARDAGYTRGNAHNGRRDDCPHRANPEPKEGE